MSKKYYLFGEGRYSSKEAIKARLSTIKSEAILGEAISGEPLAFVQDLLIHHPNWSGKSLNMAYIIVANKKQELSNGKYATDRALHIVYKDGKVDSISAKWAIESLKPSHKQELV